MSSKLNPLTQRLLARASAQVIGDVQKCSGMFKNVQQSTAPKRENNETNPPRSRTASLTARQVAAAQLLILGRTSRQTAREIGVEEHTLGRWKKLPAFRDELDRQHRLTLSMRLSGASRSSRYLAAELAPR